jgi:predicted DNA-binding protein
MRATTLSFRAPDEFAEQTRSLAKAMGLKSSDYIRAAVHEKNEREMSARIAALSKKLSAKHLAFNEAIDDSVGDGLA